MTNTLKDFKSVGLSDAMLDNLNTLGYIEMTPIQAQGLPHILKNKDFIGQANTGSGKTAAFALGILSKIDVELRLPQALVVVPTIELADQVTAEIRRLAKFKDNIKVLTVSGGLQEPHVLKSLKQGVHIVVGTVGRLLTLLENKQIIAFNINTLVLDEADRLLEMGSIVEIEKIASFMPIERQTMLFSATFPNGIKELSATLQEDAVQITVDSQHQTNTIEQRFIKADKDKDMILLRILARYNPESCIIFCNTKDMCNRVATLLRKNKISSLPLHSDLEQKDRMLTLIKFANKSCRILVATDLASRGIDVKDVSMVINYDLANNHELYVHRIGRTGREGKEGQAISMYTNNERMMLEAIGEYLKIDCSTLELTDLGKVKRMALESQMTTMYVSGGKKNNIRPGDILGALTKDAGLKSNEVGKIDILDVNSYVAVACDKVDTAVKVLSNGKIKNKKFKVGKA